MKTLVMHPKSGWILSHISKKICLSDKEFISYHRDEYYDMESFECIFYVDIQNTWNPAYKKLLPNAIHIGFFTHLHKDSMNSMKEHWSTLDGVVHMCNRYFKEFQKAGLYKDRQIVLYPGDVRSFDVKPCTIGVVQRGGFEGKGDGFLQKAWKELQPFFRNEIKLKIKGKGWNKSNFCDISSVEFDENEDYETYQDFYHSLDYLLIPSLWEGGPMSLLEALACGLPVISSRVGFVEDLIGDSLHEGHMLYSPNDVKGLVQILEDIAITKLNRRMRIEGLSYSGYTKELKKFFKEVKNDMA